MEIFKAVMPSWFPPPKKANKLHPVEPYTPPPLPTVSFLKLSEQLEELGAQELQPVPVEKPGKLWVQIPRSPPAAKVSPATTTYYPTASRPANLPRGPSTSHTRLPRVPPPASSASVPSRLLSAVARADVSRDHLAVACSTFGDKKSLGLFDGVKAPDSFPQTRRLLIGTLHGALGDPGQHVRGLWEEILIQIGIHGSKEFPGLAQVLKRSLEDPSCVIDAYLGDPNGIEVCLTSAIEQAKTGTVCWGVTNRRPSRAQDCGYLQPAINAAVCKSFENTFEDGVPTRSTMDLRAKLGALVAITLLHECTHALVRQALVRQNGIGKANHHDWSPPPLTGSGSRSSSKDVDLASGVTDMLEDPVFNTDMLDDPAFITDVLADLKTPPLEKGADESGLLFEYQAFGGVIRARWEAKEDASNDNRFDRLTSIWLQNSATLDESTDARLINQECLTAFFESLFLNQTLTAETTGLLQYGLNVNGVFERPIFVPFKTLNSDGSALLRGVGS
ncbi:hypothetical protein C8R45DRAFT_1094268 [Mycena sanguinolenta]|nr:hypothetical protein C8R45DRAFT_1094268 [Mycena sanguinolenta]